MEFRTAGKEYDIQQLVFQVARKRGANFFRCTSNKDLWLEIHADSTKWKDMDAWMSEVNIYSPISFTDPSTGAKYYYARTFGGVEVKLKSPPAWESFQVGRLVDVGFWK